MAEVENINSSIERCTTKPRAKKANRHEESGTVNSQKVHKWDIASIRNQMVLKFNLNDAVSWTFRPYPHKKINIMLHD